MKLTQAQILLAKHLEEIGYRIEYEYQFHNDRKWRFDIAAPEYRIGFEIDGFFNGKHGVGWGKDSEKQNMAQVLGWRVFRFNNKDVLTGKAKAWIEEWL